jgi:tRNA dimethylallyltransferase
VDALVNGLDDFPESDLKLRADLTARLKAEGVESLRQELRRLDPESYAVIDIANGQRVVRALEVCLMTGKPFSSFKTSPSKSRNFVIEKIGLTRPRDVLYERINRRVLQMVDDGLVDEVRSLTQYRDLAALKTVGYKEIFDWFDFLDGIVSTEGWGPTTPGDGPVTSLERAIELIQRNTRHYAKRQMSYWGRDKDIRWMEL